MNPTSTVQKESQTKKARTECKARVALEALKGVQTIEGITKNFDIHPMQVTDWKKAMATGASSVFRASRAKVEAEDFERQRDERHAKNGQWTGEVDCLRKKSKPLGR